MSLPMNSPMTERERLHAHIRRELAKTPWLIPQAIEAADAIHVDGYGSMQMALDAALTTTQETTA